MKTKFPLNYALVVSLLAAVCALLVCPDSFADYGIFCYGGVPITVYPDVDGDGYGDGTQPLAACSNAIPAGYVTNGSDCDDHNPAIHPSALEACDGYDNNCDGQIDEGCPVPAPACSIMLQNWASLSSNSVIDSFDSSNPYKSTNGLYDPAKRQMNGNLCILNSTGSDLRNAFIYGSVSYSGPAVRNTANVQGTVSTPFSAPVAAVSDPTWAPGTYTVYSGASTPVTLTAGTASNPALVKINGDLNVSGGKILSLVAANSADNNYLNIWVTGKFTTSGSGLINQDPNVHVTWIVDKDITTSGNGYNNTSGHAANVWFYAVNSAKVTIGGGGTLIATISAPDRAITIAGSLSGAIVGNTLTLNGSASVHFDEALQ